MDVGVTAFTGTFAQGAFALAIPGGLLLLGTLSLTPLSTQGLPGLLPKGWCAVSALWLHWKAPPGRPRHAELDDPHRGPGGGAGVGSVGRGGEGLGVARSAGLAGGTYASRGGRVRPPGGGSSSGGAAAGDGGPGAAGQCGKELATRTSRRRRGGSVAAAIAEAIKGARATARLGLGFGGYDPVASGTGLLAELVETYTLVSQALIEPEKRVQDGVAARFVLGVDKAGAPTLRAVADGLAMELPVRMSRTFGGCRNWWRA